MSIPGVIGRPPGFRPGDLLPGFSYGRCFRCHRPWWACTPREVPTGPSSAQFALCRGCWVRASVDERVAAHRWLSAQTHPDRVERITWAVEEASR